MNRKLSTLVFVLLPVVFIFLTLISAQVFAEETTYDYYFIQDISDDGGTGVTGVCIIQCNVTEDSVEPVRKELSDDGFEETTVAEIHNAGYLTPMEAFEQSKNRDGGETEHETWSSWCDAYPYSGAKMVSAGSRTERATIGWVYTKGTLKGHNAQGFNYERTKTCKNRFGYAATVSFQVLYPGTTPPVTWTESGHHEYPYNRIYYTQVSDTY